ncbi:hypothetical protein TRM7557_01649 [Tritonibacter multivorans]|uniref:Uncharacterized protein n=1 Tax=Tritonibacter multivorans TaxID=928856 RepID=A0A0P1GV31_9RHOB|nr:hypothetical protein [Tritonibacter multivorans]MDA7423066.1 hypothetical protein [Tritonibacter multivorans]CUH77939.1 hypothetical protein TRM7557_01649 [Tritonibacter multivorans]SFD82118.1 hypothetical protein SAMN04488049_1374 [Tritonibacter multivorans]
MEYMKTTYPSLFGLIHLILKTLDMIILWVPILFFLSIPIAIIAFLIFFITQTTPILDYL